MKKLFFTLFVSILVIIPANSQQVVEVITGNVGKNKKLTQPGIYQIKGKVIGNIEIAPSSGTIILEGFNSNAWLQGLPWGGNTRRFVSHFYGKADNGEKIILRNLTVKGDGHNAIRFTGDGDKLVTNVLVINNDTVIGGKHFPKVGSIAAGTNSEVRNCEIHTGDDAIKITEPNSHGYDSEIFMTGNGTAILLGWKEQFSGAKHYADNIDVYGYTGINVNHDNPATDINPGRAVIGGIAYNNVSDIQLTNIRLHSNDWARVIKIVVDGATFSNATIKIDALKGLKTHKDGKGRTWYPINLVARNGGKINNLVIDFGGVDLTDPAVRNKYVFISGGANIDVTWKTHPIGDNPCSGAPGETTVSKTDESVCGSNDGSITFAFNDTDGRSGIQFSIDGGANFTKVNDNTGTYTFNGLSEGTYNCQVEWGNGECTSNLGNVTINCNDDCSTIPGETTVSKTNATCGQNDGSITFTFNDSDSRTGIKFSIDGGNTFTKVNDNTGSYVFNNLSEGTYNCLVQWGNDDCPTNLGNETISCSGNTNDWFFLENIKWNNERLKVKANGEFDLTSQTGDRVQWKKISVDNTWFHLENKANPGVYLKSNDGNQSFALASNVGGRTQWKEEDAGSGNVYLINKQYNLRLLACDASGCLQMGALSLTGQKLKWKMVAAPKAAIELGESIELSANIYPNPATNEINIALKNEVNASLSIMNLAGQVVYQNEIDNGFETIVLSEFNKGFYTIHIKSKGKTIQQLLIVQ